MNPPQYQNNIPQPDQSIGGSQSPFLVNFNQLFNAFDVDHVSLTAASNAGNHNVARLATLPNPWTTNISEVSLYSKIRSLQTNQLYFREEGNGLEYQYSNYQIYPLAPITSGSNVIQIPYFSWLPGGIIVYFGYVNPFGAKTINIVLNPVVCNNISGVNLCNTALSGTPSPVQPPSVSITVDQNALADNVVLTLQPPAAAFAPQYYIIFGNAVN